MTILQLTKMLFASVPEMEAVAKQCCDVLGQDADEEEAMWRFGIMPAVRRMLREDTDSDLLRAVFSFFEDMTQTDYCTRMFFVWATMRNFTGSEETRQKARKQMLPTTRRMFDEFVEMNKIEIQRLLATIHDDVELYVMEEEGRTPEPEKTDSFLLNRYAPIIPYEGMGGLRFGWTQAQVEQVTGPLGEGVVVGDEWIRYSVGEQLWVYFGGENGDTLEKIVTLPGYGGRLFSLIDTNTSVEDLSWREPGLVWNEAADAYLSKKGAAIKPVDGKCGHIIVFSERWKHYL